MAGRALTYFHGRWLKGNPKLIGPMTHSMWLSSVVFDGARAFEGTTPDLEAHCARVVDSSRYLGLSSTLLTTGEIVELAQEGVRRFSSKAELYIRPMFFAEAGFVDPNPESTQFALSVYESAMPPATGATACLSPLRRPSPEMAPTLAKASCHYPQAALALRNAKARGFENAILCDPLGYVAEFATANLFITRDGAVHTPAPNGTFLNGITRRRVIALLRDAGVEVVQRAILPAEVLAADEVFSSGNYAKVQAYTRIEDRDLQPGPMFALARKLYWEFAHSQ